MEDFMTISNEGYTVNWNLGPREVSGDAVRLNATHKAHIDGEGRAAEGEVPDDQFMTEFRNALKDAFYRVNNLQKNSEELTKQLAVDPDSVDIHDVTIAAEKARLSLMLTKSIVDRITQAYRELINMR
jgi:flagellar hook-basal body complex protein FliE